MVGKILVDLGTLVICGIGLVVVAKGCNCTQSLLAEADEHDIVFDGLAWIDRKVWGAGSPKKARRPGGRESV